MARKGTIQDPGQRMAWQRHRGWTKEERVSYEAVLSRFCRPIEEFLADEARLSAVVRRMNDRRALSLGRRFDPGPPAGKPGEGKGWRGSWLTPTTGRGVAAMAVGN